MTIFSTTGSQIFIGPAQATDLDIDGYLALETGGQATGSITFSANPADTSTIDIDGTTVTFSAAPATGHVTIGADLSATMNALTAFLSASTDVNIAKMHYSTDGVDTLTITADALGSAGNAYTISAGTTPAASHGTASGATLAAGGGSAWLEINEVSNLGTFGDTSSAITFSSIKDSRTRKMKGARDAGSISLVCGTDMRDPGQIALHLAQTTKYYYAFKIVASDTRLVSDSPTIYYFNALVDSEKTAFGANNTVVQTTFALNINTAILDIPSAAAA